MVACRSGDDQAVAEFIGFHEDALSGTWEPVTSKERSSRSEGVDGRNGGFISGGGEPRCRVIAGDEVGHWTRA